MLRILYWLCSLVVRLQLRWVCNLTEHLTNVFLQMQITYKLLETFQRMLLERNYKKYNFVSFTMVFVGRVRETLENPKILKDRSALNDKLSYFSSDCNMSGRYYILLCARQELRLLRGKLACSKQLWWKYWLLW